MSGALWLDLKERVPPHNQTIVVQGAGEVRQGETRGRIEYLIFNVLFLRKETGTLLVKRLVETKRGAGPPSNMRRTNDLSRDRRRKS